MTVYPDREAALRAAESFGGLFCGSVVYRTWLHGRRALTFSYLGVADVPVSQLKSEVEQKQREAQGVPAPVHNLARRWFRRNAW